MLELLEGRPTERVPLLLTPQMKDAAIFMARAKKQNLSDYLRHLIAAAADSERGRLLELMAAWRGERS